ncbi:MAG: DNA polymerase beta superfamily protein [Saprospiraceae bacterium]
MTTKIQAALQDIARHQQINTLLACETGSRAWGFPSPDSDYDVRILYVHQTEWYLSVQEEKNTLDYMLENKELDISGWELRKSLILLRKSNAALLERIQSPIQYLADDDFVADMLLAAKSCYSKIATMHHYHSMAFKLWEELQAAPTYKLKKFFYALRAATLCKWILEQDAIPPIEFKKAYLQLLPQDLIQRIETLIELKSQKSESYFHAGEPELFDFIKTSIELAGVKKDGLSAGNANPDELNHLLRKYVRKYDH